METKQVTHTPGPWRTAGENGNVDRLVIGPMNENGNPMLIADCWPDSADDYGLPHTREYQANARLIAAALDLLTALSDLQMEIHAVVKFDVKKHYSLMVADAAANKAIAKATGGAA